MGRFWGSYLSEFRKNLLIIDAKQSAFTRLLTKKAFSNLPAARKKVPGYCISLAE